MKTILINASPHRKGCTDRALCELADTLRQNGIETEILWIGKKPIGGCLACGACKNTGRCIQNDIVNETLDAVLSADALVFGSPVHYASACTTLTAYMDRLFYSQSSKLAGKPACAVFSCRRGGSSAAFDRINKYFTISSMPIVSGQYWNSVHGMTAEDVEKDEEGLQIMRSLGNNMAWLMKCIECGKEHNIFFPEKETPKRTNFIR